MGVRRGQLVLDSKLSQVARTDNYLYSTVKSREPRVGRYLIYGLLDPRDNCLRYVEKTHKRREWRLAEHIESALGGSATPVHVWIQELLENGLEPLVFVIRKVPADASWQDAERQEIKRWRNWKKENLPHSHPPQTKKSDEVVITDVRLLNVLAGG